MSDEIRPALSAEEWAQRRTPLGNTDGTSFIDVGYSDGLCVGGSGTYHEVLNRHGTAALTLYGQPFGFTEDERDKLARLSEALYKFDTGWIYNHGEPYEAALRVVVAKIAALLPSKR